MNQGFVSRLKQSLNILETEDYEKGVVLHEQFLRAYLRQMLSSQQENNMLRVFPQRGITMKGCKHMAQHFSVMAEELESYADSIGQYEEVDAMMEYEEKQRYGEHLRD